MGSVKAKKIKATYNFKTLAAEMQISRNTLLNKLDTTFRDSIKIKRNAKFITLYQANKIKQYLGYIDTEQEPTEETK